MNLMAPQAISFMINDQLSQSRTSKGDGTSLQTIMSIGGRHGTPKARTAAVSRAVPENICKNHKDHVERLHQHRVELHPMISTLVSEQSEVATLSTVDPPPHHSRRSALIEPPGRANSREAWGCCELSGSRAKGSLYHTRHKDEHCDMNHRTCTPMSS